MTNPSGALPARDRRVYPIPELASAVAAPPTATDYAQFANVDSVLCIDNGATTLRAGWNREQDPRLAIDNLSSKYRDRKFNRSILLAGAEVYVDATSRAHVRAPHEGDIVTSPDVMVRFPFFFRPGTFAKSDMLLRAGKHTRLCPPQTRRRY